GLGVAEAEAPYYEKEFHAGRALVTVKAEQRTDEAWQILRTHGAYNRTNPAVAGAGAAAAPGEQKGEGREEELRATKTPVEKGEVRVRKEVVTEQQTVDVPVEREEVVIERRPARRKSGGAVGGAEEIRVPVHEEQVRVEKDAVAKEEVS